MKKPALQQKPPYPIESVDKALRLLQLLRDGGGIRLTAAAQELQIAPSTAHRLMAMLIYRGFALQDDSRRYVAGPALGMQAIGAPWLHDLRRRAQEPMEVLSSQLDETVNLVVRVGVNIRFLNTVEASRTLRIGDRSGTVIPAFGASSGKALLALEPEERLDMLYRGHASRLAGTELSDLEFEHFSRELANVRRLGYALSREETESGVGAIGVAVLNPQNKPVAGISIATPIGRLASMLEPRHLGLLFHCRDEIASLVATPHTDPI
ncbi:IclR family transcriptional regulator [Brevibacterium aurantiacum]|uniref:IclR family transcriptional regulator n=1 Tax=Brevibacterium aurantiacum TaxID=273384 RepID=A0A556C4X9_BREAU|nr:IclR family transcriptional regulator [Brevibacterium aurantiacum]TSI12451.1 IclR family transcriptional regulator [Brevibacterium aurantiacum]